MPNSLPLYEDDMTGDTTARGYGWQHQARRARWAPRVAAGQVCCVRCGQLIVPGQPWDLGHDDYDRSITTGPHHRAGASKVLDRGWPYLAHAYRKATALVRERPPVGDRAPPPSA